MSSWLLLFVLLAMVEAKGLKTIGSNARDQEVSLCCEEREREINRVVVRSALSLTHQASL